MDGTYPRLHRSLHKNASLVFVGECFQLEHEIIGQGSACETTALGGMPAWIVGRRGRLSRRVHGRTSGCATASHS